MKKTFEFILILIIFYGVYSLFDGAATYLFEKPNGMLVILAALTISALLLVLYKHSISSEVKQKMKKNIDDLKTEIKNKELEVKKAKTFKDNLIAEAEQTEIVE